MQTMRRFDASCLTPVHEFTVEEIRAFQKREEVSQVVFARYLNVTKESVSQWEKGLKKTGRFDTQVFIARQKQGTQCYRLKIKQAHNCTEKDTLQRSGANLHALQADIQSREKGEKTKGLGEM